MSTITHFKINGLESTPPREWLDLQVSATFDNDSVQANVNFSALNFVNKANKQIVDWFDGNIGPTEGIPFEINVEGENNTIVPLEGYLDWTTYIRKSAVASEMSVVKNNGLNGFSERAQGITMALLEFEGIMPTSDGVNIPYLIANRKTDLEKIQLVATAFITLKTAIDEVFKIINITADLTTGGAFQAVINLTTSIASLVLLINQLGEQLKAIQEAFFPLVRYHRGIKLITFLQRGCEKMGYTLDVGNGVFATELDKLVLCPHKDDEEGQAIGFQPPQILDLIQNSLSGILKPNDFGYVLSEAFELSNKIFFTKISVQGSVVTLLPFNDPFWTLNPTYQLPDVKIEDAIYSNGIQSFNIEELKSRTLIEYEDDSSDRWTISNVNNSVGETIVTPTTIVNEKNVAIRGLDHVQIPYVLCIRKEAIDDLFNLFKDLVSLNDQQVQVIKDTFSSFAGLLQQAFPQVEQYILAVSLREGAMKVENHFFSKPKIVYLENGKIPSNFNDKIGAPALYEKYHSYKSFVPGVKDPSNPNNTNQKRLFKEVRIEFGIESFNQITNNSYFNATGGKIGKFTSILWNVSQDFATVDYYIIENYMGNLQETNIIV